LQSEIGVGSLVGVGFMRYFAMRGLEMQLCLFECTLIDWLGIFCMVHVMFGRNVTSWSQYRGLLLSLSDNKGYRLSDVELKRSEVVDVCFRNGPNRHDE
jgi:hypothetical protein